MIGFFKSLHSRKSKPRITPDARRLLQKLYHQAEVNYFAAEVRGANNVELAALAWTCVALGEAVSVFYAAELGDPVEANREQGRGGLPR